MAALTLAVAMSGGCSRPQPSAVSAQPDVTPEPIPAASAPAPAPPPEPAPAPEGARPKIVAFGDSITAGFGLEKSESYPSLLQRMLDEHGYSYDVVNAGVSGETSAGGARRIDHVLGPDVQVVIVELGGNDGLRGLPPKDLKKNLAAIVEKAKSHGARVLLTGMEAPPFLGQEYTSQFRSVFPEVAREERVPVMPFLLVGVAGNPDLNQVDGIHPNQRGAEIVAANVFKQVEPLLRR